jgi:hypothetical protein
VNALMLCAGEGDGADGRGSLGRGRIGARALTRALASGVERAARESDRGNGSACVEGDGPKVGHG